MDLPRPITRVQVFPSILSADRSITGADWVDIAFAQLGRYSSLLSRYALTVGRQIAPSCSPSTVDVDHSVPQRSGDLKSHLAAVCSAAEPMASRRTCDAE